MQRAASEPNRGAEALKQLRAVLFDFDGVILDSETVLYESWQRTYVAHGCSLSLDLWAANVGGYNYDVFDPLDHLEKLHGHPIDKEAVNAARRACYLHHVCRQDALPGVREAVMAVNTSGLKLAVVSSSSRRWVQGHLQRLGLDSFFDALCCGDEVEKVKPDPELYLTALKRLGVRAKEACAIEDSPKGLTAAQAVGLYCIAVPNTVTRSSKLSGYSRMLASLDAMPFQKVLVETDELLLHRQTI
jgi:HAD superfamily hydrolase (TIGR01509 family)